MYIVKDYEEVLNTSVEHTSEYGYGVIRNVHYVLKGQRIVNMKIQGIRSPDTKVIQATFHNTQPMTDMIFVTPDELKVILEKDQTK